MAQTPFQYYSSESNFGKYQYVMLKEIIDDLELQAADPDDFLSNTKRSRLLLKARSGIRTLSREVKKTVKAMEITVSPTLYIALPQDYVDWVRISVVSENYRLKSLMVNDNIPTAAGYLQDTNYEILFDDNGQIVKADSSNLFNKPVKKYEWEPPSQANYGEFVIDEIRGVIGFTSELEDKEVVVEYISDGLEADTLSDEEVYIHKSLREALVAYTYSECISTRRDVPMNEKTRARNHYLKLLHRAKIDNLHFNVAYLDKKIEYAPTGDDIMRQNLD